MFAIAKQTIIGAMLLIILPLLLLVNGWKWQGYNNHSWLIGLYWLTQTVTYPWGILTSILLISWFFWCRHYRLKQALALVVILIITMLLGQSIKLLIKDRVQKPRPFIVWLNKYYSIDNQDFYAMPSKARRAAVAYKLQNKKTIPPWLQYHWKNEIAFSFPSGHTIFAASWALLYAGLLWPNNKNNFFTIILLLLWANGVIVSRIFMGLHWPQDIIMSIIISFLTIILLFWLIQRLIVS